MKKYHLFYHLNQKVSKFIKFKKLGPIFITNKFNQYFMESNFQYFILMFNQILIDLNYQLCVFFFIMII
jgi:hypothetical protein